MKKQNFFYYDKVEKKQSSVPLYGWRVNKYFVIHRTIKHNGDKPFVSESRKDGWRVTHIMSGAAIPGYYRTKADAIQCAKEITDLQGTKWDAKHYKDVEDVARKVRQQIADIVRRLSA